MKIPGRFPVRTGTHNVRVSLLHTTHAQHAISLYGLSVSYTYITLMRLLGNAVTAEWCVVKSATILENFRW